MLANGYSTSHNTNYSSANITAMLYRISVVIYALNIAEPRKRKQLSLENILIYRS